MALRVIVAEDSKPFLAGLLDLLRLAGRVEVVATPKDTVELRASVEAYAPELIILDYELEDGSVLPLLQTGLLPQASCVVLTAFPSSSLRAALLQTGVAAFFDKGDIVPFLQWIQAHTT